MGTERTATNPETGERIKFVDGQWVPIEPIQQPSVDISSSNTKPASAVFSDTASRTVANNLMALPSASGDLLAGAAGLAQTIAQTPFNNSDQGFLERLSSNYESQQHQFPANALRAIPRPTVSGISAAAQSLPALMPGGESFGDAYSRNRQEIQQERDQQAEQSPMASYLGEMTGDVLTIASGRQPFAKDLVNRSSSIPRVTNRATRDALETIAKEHPELVPQVAELVGSGRLAAPGVQRLWHRMVDGPLRSSLRGLGKAAETSMESAVLSAIKENDPVTNAGLAGGAQLATSMIGSVLGMPKSMGDLALKAGGLFALFRLGQEFIPTENDSYQAIDTTFNKLAMAMTIGIGSQVVGGRFRGSETLGRKFAEDMPRFSDFINTIPRASFMSLLNQVQSEQESGTGVTLQTLETLSTNPQRFPEALRNRLNRSLENNNFAEEMRRLGTNEALLEAIEGN